MTKIVFISSTLNQGNYGGAVWSNNIYQILAKLVGEKNISVLQLHPIKNRLFNKFFNLVEYEEIANITSDILLYDVVFLDSSLLGVYAKQLREKGYKGKIITNFHNCEYNLFSQLMKNKNLLTRKITLRYVAKNELYSLKYSDHTICLNQRDFDSIANIYRINPSIIIPISIEDRYLETSTTTEYSGDKPQYLFIGSAFAPNINGLCWFVKNVYPKVSIHLKIVGKGMDILSEELQNTDIEIYDNVLDLTPFLNEADYMLFPIFEGSGMKLKTCEALMYGKAIIGTKEAFEGYDINEIFTICSICTDADDFVKTINHKTTHRKFYTEVRDLYLKKYSLESAVPLFNNLIN